MGISARETRAAYLAAAEAELKSLEARGVRMEGDGFSPIVLVKGELNDAERAGAALLGSVAGARAVGAVLDIVSGGF